MEALSWTPESNGSVYCAPACGRGCTTTEYNRAVKKVDKLAKRMGNGWTPRVWENLGWHYAVISPCGRLKVLPPSGCGDSFVAILGPSDSEGGRWVEGAKAPEEAVKVVLEAARKDIECGTRSSSSTRRTST